MYESNISEHIHVNIYLIVYIGNWRVLACLTGCTGLPVDLVFGECVYMNCSPGVYVERAKTQH